MILFFPMMKDRPDIAIKPFCADAIQKSTLSFTTSRGIIPNVEVVSLTKIAPYLWASAPISLIGFNTPVPVS